MLRRRRDVDGALDRAPRDADPVLRAPELARRRVLAPHPFHEPRVELAQEPERQGQGLEPGHAVLERRHVVADFADVGRVAAGRALRDLFEQQLPQGRHRPLDPGGQHGLPADVGGDEQMGVGQVPSEPRQLAERRIRPGEGQDELVVVDELGRERRGEERVVPPLRADDSPGLGRPEVGGIHGRVSPL